MTKRVRRHRGVQVENGYTLLADELLEAIFEMLGHELTLAETRIMGVVIRNTYGFGKKSNKFSISYLSKVTGYSERHIKNMVKLMIQKRLLILYNESTSTEARELGVNTNYWEWEVPRRAVDVEYIDPEAEGGTPVHSKWPG